MGLPFELFDLPTGFQGFLCISHADIVFWWISIYCTLQLFMWFHGYKFKDACKFSRIFVDFG